MEDAMRYMSWLTATSLAMATAACELPAGGPKTYRPAIEDGSPSSGVPTGSDPALPMQSRPAPVRYSPAAPAPVGYVPVAPVPSPQPTASPSAPRPVLRQDEPDRRPAQYGRDRDLNADGIPDRYQYKQPEPPRSLLHSSGPDPRNSILGPPPIPPPASSSLGSPLGPLR